MKPKVPRYITVKWLKERNACKDEIRRFKRVFGDGARVTKANLRTAAERGLDLLWWLGKLGVRLIAVCMCSGCCPDSRKRRAAARRYVDAIWKALHGRVA